MDALTPSALTRNSCAIIAIIRLALELDPEEAVDLLRKWHEGNWR